MGEIGLGEAAEVLGMSPRTVDRYWAFARAWLHRGIRPSSIFVPIGWDEQQPWHPSSSVNHLTGIRLDPISQQANLKTHLCRVRKASY